MIDVNNFFEGTDYIEKKSIINRPSKVPPSKKENENEPHSSNFESRVWRLFYDMGAQVINGKETLKFDIRDLPGANQDERQVDVFAILRNKYVFFIECKTSSSNTKATKLTTHEIPQLKCLKSPLQKRYEKIFTDKIQGSDYIPIHIIATQGFEWTDNNFNKVKDDFIVLRDEELKYFEECYRASGNSWFTFNQFLGFFRSGHNDFGKKEVNKSTNRSVKVPLSVVAFQTRVGDLKAYTSSMRVKDLLNISTVSHKRASNIYEVDDYIQGYYQRILKKTRLTGDRGLPNFIKTKNQAFVNNLLINYRGKKSLKSIFQKKDDGEGRGGVLRFDTLSPGMFHLIDGQHRLFGYSPLIEEDNESLFGQHELIITLFDNLDPKDEARIFLNINENQKPIDAGLKYQVNLIFGDDGKPETVIENIASSIVEGFSVPVGDKDANRQASPFLSPRAIKDTENIKIIDSKTGIEEPSGALTFRAMVTEIKKSRMISNGEKGATYVSGIGFKKDYASTIEKISNVYKKYFDEIRNANESLWVTKTSDDKEVSNTKKIARNYVIGGFILLLDRFIKQEDVRKDSKIFESIEHHVEKLCGIIKKLSKKDEDSFFGVQKYGDGGSKAYDLYLTETYFKELLTKKDHIEIAKRKDDAERKYQDPSLIETIENLTEIINEKEKALKELNSNNTKKRDISKEKDTPQNRNKLAQIYEKEFKTLLHHFLVNHYGKDYWSETLEKFSAGTDIKLARKAKNDLEEEHINQSRSKYKIPLSYLNCEQLGFILRGVMAKDEDVKSKIQKYWEIPYGVLEVEEKDYDQQKRKDQFYFLRLINVLRRFNDAGHTVVHGDVDTTKPIEKNEFDYYCPLMDKKIEIIKNKYLKS
tara:strand:+ start:399 stop:3008 length:2610 start_codon:yes stop_codon:yes gene_type:complete